MDNETADRLRQIERGAEFAVKVLSDRVSALEKVVAVLWPKCGNVFTCAR